MTGEHQHTAALLAPFPYFGGKRSIIVDVWQRLGEPKQYIEPFCGSAAMLLGAPRPASLEVISDGSGFIANFWRAVKHQPEAVATWADYPVSHVDLGARHQWLMAQRARVAELLANPNDAGDAQVAGWWLWGQCAWIGEGWCDWEKPTIGQIPHASNAEMGIQAIGQIPHASDAGRGIQAIGQIPHVDNAGMGVLMREEALLTSGGRTAWRWLRQLADRLERVRVVHGDWSRCLNHHYGKTDTAIFFDPPYKGYEKVYGVSVPVAVAVEDWAREHPDLRIALCGHAGDYALPGWELMPWSRRRLTYGGSGTTEQEVVWFSPACEAAAARDIALDLFTP